MPKAIVFGMIFTGVMVGSLRGINHRILSAISQVVALDSKLSLGYYPHPEA